MQNEIRKEDSMILRVEQQIKNMWSALFYIFEDEDRIGWFEVQGKMGSMEANILMEISGKKYEMAYSGEKILKEKRIPGTKDTIFRPYHIECRYDEKKGDVWQCDRKTGMFRISSFYQMEFNDKKYDLYPIGFGNEGGKHPVYCGDTQIAQVEKPGEIRDDMHNYTIYAIDSDAAELSVLLVAYMYVNANYKPGEKVTKSYVKCYSVTKSKTLLSKYDPEFKEKLIRNDN